MKKFITVSVLAVACLVFTASIALADYGTDNSLGGKVGIKGTTQVIAKAKVSLYKESGRKIDSMKTSGRGKYYFDELTEGTYIIKVQAVGYHSSKNVKKTTISYKVDVDGKTTKNAYLVK